MNGISKLTSNAKKALKNSYNLVKSHNQNTLELSHLLLGLVEVEEGIAGRVLVTTGFDKLIREHVEPTLETLNQSDFTSVITISDDYRKALEHAFNIARFQFHVYVGSEHILLGALKLKRNPVVMELAKAGLTYDYIEKYISTFANYPIGLLAKYPVHEEKGNSILPVLGRNLVEAVNNSQVDSILGRDKEIDRIIHILERRSKNNPILIGEAGVGKTAIVEGLAQRIAKGEVPDDLLDAQVWAIDTAKLMASTEMRGDLEAKVMTLIEEINNKKNIILFIDEIHGIVGNGNGGNDISSILKPYLTRGSMRCIGATTLSEFQKFFEPDAALTRRFQSVLVNEIAEDTAIVILKNLKTELEKYHKIKISEEAIVGAVKLSNRYISERYLPDKAIDVLDEAAAKLKLERQGVTDEMKVANSEISQLEKEKETFVNDNNFDRALEIRRRENELKIFLDTAYQNLKRTRTSTKYVVNEELIRNIISSWTGVPIQTLSTSDKSSLKDIEKNMKKQIIGQDIAVSKVTHAIKSARLGIRNAKRPLASFLFLGPTGVGKTELAKQIAIQLFGDTRSLIHIDMSEYMESHTVSKFIGSPPGYIGSQEGGQLTEKVRRRPYSVILFDEIEKAHIEVLNILLQILEEGHLTDNKGRIVNFKNTIIILTSNIGANIIKNDKLLGFNLDAKTNTNGNTYGEAYDEMRDKILEEMKSYLTPEFVNRLDDIIVFRGLDRSDIEKIAEKLLNELKVRLKESKLNLTFDKDVIRYIADKGFNKEYGARPLNRAIEEHIEFPLSDKLLTKDFGKIQYIVKATVQSSTSGEHIAISMEEK